MTVPTGSRLGPYQLQDRIASTESGEQFTASEPGLERPVSVVVTPLPDDDATRDAIRARARALAGLGDARLLPVYGQGEDAAVIWLATRMLGGRSLAKLGRLEPARATRLGAQLARQVAALGEAGLAPAALAPDDVALEGQGEGERAWLIPDPARPTAESPADATRALVQLLNDRTGRRLVADTPADPTELAQVLDARARARPRTRRLLLIGAVALAAAGGLAAGLALALGSGGAKHAPAGAPIARVVARIPLNVVPYSIVASDRGVWAVTADGLLVHVDPRINRVVGNPTKLLPDRSYPIFFSRGDSLYVAAGDLIRLDARTGRVLRRVHVRGKQPFIASLYATRDALWATVSEQSSFAESLVRYDPVTLRELSRSKPFGSAPFLALVDRRSTLAVNQADGTLTKISSRGRTSTIAVSAGLQANRSVYAAGRLWIPTHVDHALTEVDPNRMVVERAIHVAGWTSSSAAGAGSVWVLTERPSRVYRVDPSSARILGRPIPAPSHAVQVAFGAGSLWVDDPNTKALVRLAPTSPAPAPAPLPRNDRTLREGPLPVRKRLVDRAVAPRLSVRAPDAGWLTGPLMSEGAQFEPMTAPGTGVALVVLATPAPLFEASGRLIRVRTPPQFLDVLRRNPNLSVSRATPTSIGDVRALRVIVRAHPKPPYPSLCHGLPCVLILPLRQGTYLLLGGATDEITLATKGGKLVLVDVSTDLGAGTSMRSAQKVLTRGRRLVASIRFEP